MTEMLVDKADLRRTRFAPAQTAVDEGQALLRIDRFALTSNNVTYAAIGEQFGYWKFFPAPAPWGKVPVWGFADVVESRAPDLAVGERIWGYWPIATHMVLTPGRVTQAGFVDAAAHRAELAPVYNQYERVAADPAWRREAEAQIALFRPLFVTGFLLDDFVAENEAWGAGRVALAAASSKTALSLAKLLKARGIAEVVGLTSARNADFVRLTGYYDRVVAYSDLGALPADDGVALVDMAGDGAVIHKLADRLGERFVYNCMVGAAHWDAPPAETRGPARSLFFAPDRIVKRRRDWGPEGFAARYGEAWAGFIASTAPWLKVMEERGEAAVGARWQALLDGAARPEEGFVLGL